MRTKFLFMSCSFLMLFFTLSSFKTEIPPNEIGLISQDSKTVEAVYNGNDENGYNFKDSESNSLLFQNIDDAVLSEFNLSTQDLVGVSYNVTYTTKTEVVKDLEGNDLETEVHTITKLEKL